MDFYNTPHVRSNNADNKFSESFTLNIHNNTSVEQNNKVSSDIWKELGSEYDVREATFDEICKISNKLYEAGEITLREHAILTFDYDRATKDIIGIARNLGREVSPSYSMYATESNGNGERDWIAEYEARIKQDFKQNNMIGYHNNKKILDILNELDG